MTRGRSLVNPPLDERDPDALHDAFADVARNEFARLVREAYDTNPGTYPVTVRVDAEGRVTYDGMDEAIAAVRTAEKDGTLTKAINAAPAPSAMTRRSRRCTVSRSLGAE